MKKTLLTVALGMGLLLGGAYINDLNDNYQELQKEHEQTKETLSVTTKHLVKKQNEVAKLENELKTTQNKVTEQTKANANLKTLLSKSDNEIEKLKEELAEEKNRKK